MRNLERNKFEKRTVFCFERQSRVRRRAVLLWLGGAGGGAGGGWRAPRLSAARSAGPWAARSGSQPSRPPRTRDTTITRMRKFCKQKPHTTTSIYYLSGLYFGEIIIINSSVVVNFSK